MTEKIAAKVFFASNSPLSILADCCKKKKECCKKYKKGDRCKKCPRK